ncbi:putative nicotinate-nucleotide adenylyltransferase [Dictyocaulus viviparus]|uniref:Putative nicotinate-nucleotide adenylyltransferase n=1 Tax=Dictyocaulus viviparus TaxID=29172 RepID=A0A0D8Y799_DICVI|nr:putative nicotinate-nucleotide adenylyltransferase [Dictyocaulus viviparus]
MFITAADNINLTILIINTWFLKETLELSMSSDPSTSLHGCSVALLSCGQFDPPTYAHLRMFERARDFLMRTMGCKVVEGIMNVSPDKLSTRALAKHRLRMVETAVRKNFWIRAGGFECNQKTSMKLVTVIKHYQEKLSHKYDEPIQVMYVCGSEELDNFVSTKTDNSSTWSPSEVKELLQNHGLVVLRRARTHPSQTIYLTDILRQYQDETFPNDLRCSRIRIALRRGESVRYCLDDDVIEYITEHNLYETSSDHNYADCLPTTSTRRYCDAYKVPPESPRQSFFDGLNGKYKDNMVSSLKWGTSCSSLPSECSSREESGSSHLPPKNLHSNANLIVSDRHTAKSLKTEAETLSYPSELQLNRQLCDSIPSTTLSETISNHISVTATGKNDVAVANRLVPEHPLTPCTVDNTQINDFADENHHNVVPGVMQTSVTSAPISSQPNFVADIALEKKQTGCEVIPSCVDISPAPTNGDGKQRGSTNSPAYDNATLDDIVAASNSWAMYMQKENKRVQGLKNEDCKESLVPSGWLSKSVTPKREKDKKRCWFFNRSDNNLEDVDLSNEERSPVRMCSTYQQRQNHTSPELLWQKNNQSMHDERWCEIPTSSRSLLHNLPQSDQYTLGLSNDTISKSMTTSDIVHSTRTRFATPLSNTKMITQSRREHKAKHGDGVTLRFRRYNLTSTTETTV